MEVAGGVRLPDIFVDTGYFIDSDGHIYGRSGRTGWWVRAVGDREVIEGRAGQTGFEINLGQVVSYRGGDTGFYVIDEGRRRSFHGPDDVLPWMLRPGGGLRPPRADS
jgi:hypothetical protein